MYRVLSLLGIAKKAGYLEIGGDAVSACAARGKARLIFSASDASEPSKRRARMVAETARIPHAEIPATKFDLAEMLGRGAPGTLAVTDPGLAYSVAARLADLDGDRYGEIAALLKEKSEKAIKRRREAAAHRRNKRMGKRRTTK